VSQQAPPTHTHPHMACDVSHKRVGTAAATDAWGSQINQSSRAGELEATSTHPTSLQGIAQPLRVHDTQHVLATIHQQGPHSPCLSHDSVADFKGVGVAYTCLLAGVQRLATSVSSLGQGKGGCLQELRFVHNTPSPTPSYQNVRQCNSWVPPHEQRAHRPAHAPVRANDANDFQGPHFSGQVRS
jgi:hypothetical protein